MLFYSTEIKFVIAALQVSVPGSPHGRFFKADRPPKPQRSRSVTNKMRVGKADTSNQELAKPEVKVKAPPPGIKPPTPGLGSTCGSPAGKRLRSHGRSQSPPALPKAPPALEPSLINDTQQETAVHGEDDRPKADTVVSESPERVQAVATADTAAAQDSGNGLPGD